MASKKSLSTTGHNIANANNESYTRQRVEHESYMPLRRGNVILGQGVDVKAVRRIHDELLEKRLRSTISDNNYFEERVYNLNQLEDIFNETDGDGLNKLLNKFFNSFRELANQPENDTLREIVRDSAHLIVNDFHRVDDRITSLKNGMDIRIEKTIQDINTLTEQIAGLNIEITRLELDDGAETGDLRDQRDEAIKNLSEFFKVHTYTDEKGQFTVNAVGIGSLVSGGQHQYLEASLVRESDDPESSGKMGVFFQGRPNVMLNNKFEEGRLQALVKTRNEDVFYLKDKIDTIAFQLAHSVNAIHSRGFVNKMLPVDGRGIAYNDGSLKQLTGIDFFNSPNAKLHAARKLKLSNLVQESSDYIATALAPNSPGDNRVSLAITKLQHEKIGSNGTATFEEDYLKVIGNIGVKTAKSKINIEHTKGILAQVKSMRERVSGVSLDEEAANLVKFQHMYEASARVIQASQEMFDAVMNIKR